MGITTTEQNILGIVGELRKATKFQIQQQTGFSPGYVEYICKYLIRSGYLKSSGQGCYVLAPRGKKQLVLLGWELKIDESSLKGLASQVAQEVSKAIRTRGTTREVIKERTIYREPEAAKEKIEIKTDYVLPIEDETMGLETNIGKVGTKIEKEGTEALDASVRLLKSLKKVKNYGTGTGERSKKPKRRDSKR